MKIIELDLLGQKCPIPVQKTRKLLREISKSNILHIKCDDPETLQDIPALLERLQLNKPKIKEIENGWIFVINPF